MANPVVFDPTTRLLVEQPVLDPNSPTPSSIVLTGPLGTIGPQLCNYAEPVQASEPIAQGDWVNVYYSGAVKLVRRALASDLTRPAMGFVNAASQVGATSMVYYTGPNGNVNSVASSLGTSNIGAPVYLSSSVPGSVQLTPPSGAGQLRQFLGYLTDVQSPKANVMCELQVQAGFIPSQTGNSGKYLTTDGTSMGWSALPSQIPAQTGNSGKFLTTNGTVASWGTPAGFTDPMTALGSLIKGGALGVPAELPIGTAGQVLTVVAGEPAWAALPGPGGTGLQYVKGDGTLGTLDTLAVAENTNLYFTEPRVLATVLTGLPAPTNAPIAATDTVLQAQAKLQGQVSTKGSVALVAGYALVSDAGVSATSKIFLQGMGLNGSTALGVLCADATTGSFTIYSYAAGAVTVQTGDTRVVAYEIYY